MQIPNSLQDAWNKASQDGNITVDEYKELVKAAVPNNQENELDENEKNFLVGLKSELEKNGIAAKGSVPIGVLNFGDAPAKSAPENNANAENKAPVNNEEPQVSTQSANNNKSLTFPLPEPQLPTSPVLLNWPGYNKQVNTAFANAFGEKPPTGSKVPVLSNPKAEPIVSTFGFGSVKQLQQLVGAKQDDKFGPETYFRAKTHVATQINGTQDLQKMQQLKSILGVLGNDSEVSQMQALLDKRIEAMQSYQGTKQALESYFQNVNNIIGQADPKKMESLVAAKTNLQAEFDKLPGSIKTLPQVTEAQTQAMTLVDNAIKALQAELETQDIAQQKTKLVAELNDVVGKTMTAAFTTGDTNKIKEGKALIDTTLEKYPKVKDSEDIKTVKQQAIAILDGAVTKIDTINALIAKPDWTAEDTANANKFLAELPEGDFKAKLAKSIETHSDAYKLKEKNKTNLPTTREGLHDVIGNGFWNLENKEGTKGMFQLIAKQGLLGEAITKMSVDDQVRAIKVLTGDVKADKMSDGDNFNIAIARSIYENLSKSANVDDEFNKKKVLPLLKKEAASMDFSKYKVDSESYVNGMKFSIGSDRMGSEQEAALTMVRGIMNGEVSKSILGSFNRYELNDLSKYIEKKGSADEKKFFLSKTVASAYNEGIAVNIESLDKSDKAKVVKGVLDIDGVNESKVSDLLKKAGKKTIFETVRNENLSDKQLSVVGKHVDGDDMADEPDVGAKLLVGMVKQYNKQEASSPVTIDNIRTYIDQVDKDWWEDDDTMKLVLKGLGDGPDSEYAKFQKLAPATLDKVWKIAD